MPSTANIPHRTAVKETITIYHFRLYSHWLLFLLSNTFKSLVRKYRRERKRKKCALNQTAITII